VLLVLVTGPPGAGKSTVATAVHNRLGDDGVANALVESDELRRSHPALAPQRVCEHVAFLVRSYREVGHHLVIVTETLESRADYEQLLSAVAPEEVFLVRLDAEVETLQARITAREPASWSGLSELLASASRLASAMRLLADVDLVVSTQTGTADDAASRIVTALEASRRSP
jgi:predicted kinase